MGSELDKDLPEYFERDGTVERWWTPDTGPMRFHYDAEIAILDDCLQVDPKWRVLDVGTGRGRFGHWFAERGCQVVGVDLSNEMIEEATRGAAERQLADTYQAVKASADDLSRFADESFDVVLCMELFDHLPELDSALSEMRRVLAPDGRLFFTYVPDESLYGALGNAYRWMKTKLAPREGLISRTYGHSDIRRRLSFRGLGLERFWGIGVLCLSAQTRLFGDNPLNRMLTALARAESARWPYYEKAWLARRGAHVVALARPL